MAVCRIEKTSNFTVIHNHIFKNNKLSLKAKGLLAQMLSQPDDWDYTIKGLTYICSDGVDSINSAVKELERNGYISRTRIRNEKGQLKEIEYIIREYPIDCEKSTPKTDKPTVEKPKQQKPKMENPIQEEPRQVKHAQLNTNKSNTKKSSKDKSNPYQSNNKANGYETIGCDSFSELKELVYENIEYEHIKTYGDENTKNKIDEIADIIIEVLCSTKSTINIAGEDYPAELVKSKMLKIDLSHIEYVVDCLDKNTTYVRNIKRYLLATLFNAPSTIDSYYTSKVNYHMNQ